MSSSTASLSIGIALDLGSSGLGFISSMEDKLETANKKDSTQNETYFPLNEFLNDNTSSFFKGPTIFSASWLPDIEKQINDSVSLSDSSVNNENDGSEISEAISQAAIGFFQTTSDLFDSEPYIYSSKRGDLVAEFRIPNANITSIIGQSFILLFMEKNGKITEKNIDFNDIYSDVDRKKIRNLVSDLLAA